VIKVNITYFAEHSDVSRSRGRRVLSGGQARLPAVLGRERVGGARGEELGLGLLPPVVVESHDVTLRIRWTYACALIDDPGATLDDLREAVGTLEAVAKLWKRVMGERHPEMAKVQSALATVREKLADARASESKPPP
jgi:hypothetical protein